MPDTAPPRLPQQLPTNQPAYAPIAPAAVAAVFAAIVFAVLVGIFGILAFLNGRSLLETWLLVFAALAVVLAFVARRQIRASEGARTGESWANTAWYVGIVGGSAFVAYLAAVQYSVRRDATREFVAWSDRLHQADVRNPSDPNLAAAAFHAMSAGQRVSVKSPNNTAAIVSIHQDLMQGLRMSDLGRLVARNGGELTINPGSINRWEVKPSSIDCILTGTAESPEGIRSILVPLTAEYTESKQRIWHVLPPPASGYIIGRSLTPYGWAVEAVELSARTFAMEMFGTLQRPGQFAVAYDGFVREGGDPATAQRMVEMAEPAAALVGPVASFVLPTQSGFVEDLPNRVFTLPDGNAPTGADRELFTKLWMFPGRLVPAGASIKGNPDVEPDTRLTADDIEVSIPTEFIISINSQKPPTARGKVVVRLTPEGLADVKAKLAALKAQAATDSRTDQPDMNAIEPFRKLPWRVVKIVSDLKPWQPATAQLKQIGEPGGL